MKKMIKKIAAAFMAMALVAVGMLAANKAEVKAATTVIVAGEAALCGSNWDATDDTNAMTNNAGVWSKTYSDVAVGTYQFKVVADTVWKGLNGTDANVQFAVGTVCDVTITYNETTGAIEVNGSGLVTPTLDVEKIIIAGSAGLFGTNFGVSDDNNKMTASNDVYTKTYTDVAAGTYEAKFTANGAWSDNWGGTYIASGTESEAVYNANGNISFAVPYTQATVTFELDLTDFDYGTKTGATFTITVVDTTPNESPTGDDEEETTTVANDDDDENTTTTVANDDDDETPTTTVANDDDDENTTTTVAAADDDDENTTTTVAAADDDDENTTTVATGDEGGSSAEDTPAGDSSMVAIFAILAVLAAAGVVTVAVAKRRAIEE